MTVSEQIISDFIGGEKPVAGPRCTPTEPAPVPTGAWQPTPKRPVIIVRYEATGVLFEKALYGETLTYEDLWEAFADVNTVAKLEDEVTDDRFEDQFEFDFEDPYSGLCCDPVFDADLKVGDLVTYFGECSYNDDMPTPDMLGEVVKVEREGEETRVVVRFRGWNGGHCGDAFENEGCTEFYNFWFDENGDSDEGHLKKYT